MVEKPPDEPDGPRLKLCSQEGREGEGDRWGLAKECRRHQTKRQSDPRNGESCDRLKSRLPSQPNTSNRSKKFSKNPAALRMRCFNSSMRARDEKPRKIRNAVPGE